MSSPSLPQHLPKLLRQKHIRQVVGEAEERGDLLGGEAGVATADGGDEEGHFGMYVGEADEFVDFAGDGFEGGAHRGDGVAAALEATALAVDGAEAFEGEAGGTAVVVAGRVAAEDEDLAVAEGIGTWRRHTGQGLARSEEVVFKIDPFARCLGTAHFLIVFAAAGADPVPHHR